MMKEPPVRGDWVVLDDPNGAHRIVYDLRENRYFRLGVREAGFLEALDGSMTAAQLAQGNHFGFTTAEVNALLDWFMQHGLLESETPDNRTTRKVWNKRSWSLLYDIGRWKFRLYNPDPLLDQHRLLVDALFSRKAYLVYLAILVAPAAAFLAAPNGATGLLGALTTTQGKISWMALYFLLLVMNILHEMAHAVACKHFGGKVPAIGVMMFFLQPILYCDVTDSWRFRMSDQRVIVSAAGLFAQGLLSALAVTAWLFTEWPVLMVFALVNGFILAANLFPFVKLDGYWILVHVLGEPNLQKKAVAALVESLLSCVGKRVQARAMHSRRGALVAFGAAHLLGSSCLWGLGLWGTWRAATALGVSSVVAWAVTSPVAGIIVARALVAAKEHVSASS